MLADLFGAPATVEQLLHHCPQLDIHGQLAWPGPGSTAGCAPVRRVWVIRAASRVGVAAQLSADRRRSSSQLACDRAYGSAEPMQIGDVQSFVLGEEPRRDHRRRRTYRTVGVYATVDAHS